MKKPNAHLALTHPLADAIRAAYRAGEDDETLEPLVLTDFSRSPLGRFRDGDYIIFYNIRGEREIQLTGAFTQSDFDKFPRQPLSVHFTTMIRYHPELDVEVAFPPLDRLGDTLSDVVAAAGLRQIKICESEKAVHLSFFFNGKKNHTLPGEERLVIESPRVSDYSTVPGLSAEEVTTALLATLRRADHDLIVANYANVDVVGHIENARSVQAAIETVDAQVGRVLEAAREAGYHVIITADHGTVERWYYPDGSIDTGHTDSPVPFILIPSKGGAPTLRPTGELSDVAPTILQLLGLPTPTAMSGRSLLLDNLKSSRQPTLLLILDGWGSHESCEANLITTSQTPHMCRLLTEMPTALLEAAGPVVGMPVGTVGNSEVGHLHLGAGRRIPSDRVRIDRSIEDGSFFENPVFIKAMDGARQTGRRLHLLGIISFYSSHGSLEHLRALMQMASQRGVPEWYVHGMLGRRGERPESGALYVEQVEHETALLRRGQLVSVIGRYWSLDREENWDRIEKTYRWLVEGAGRQVQAGEAR